MSSLNLQQTPDSEILLLTEIHESVMQKKQKNCHKEYSFVQLYFFKTGPCRSVDRILSVDGKIQFLLHGRMHYANQQKVLTKLRLKLTSTRGMILVSEGSTFSNSASAGLSGNLHKPKHVST